MKYFFIDFENVGAHGLKGCSDIGPEDKVILMYSGSPKFDIETVIDIHKLGDRLSFYKNTITNLNALDFQMTYWIGYISGQMSKNTDNEPLDIIIISNDKGYDVIKNTIQYLNLSITLHRTSSIANYYKNPTKTVVDAKSNDNNDKQTQPSSLQPSQKPKQTSEKIPRYPIINTKPALKHMKDMRVSSKSKPEKLIKGVLSVLANINKNDYGSIVKNMNRISSDFAKAVIAQDKKKSVSILEPYFIPDDIETIYAGFENLIEKINRAKR